jgi:hypothetical protein
MANMFGRLGYEGNIKANPKVGPGETEVDLYPARCMPTYRNECGNGVIEIGNPNGLDGCESETIFTGKPVVVVKQGEIPY